MIVISVIVIMYAVVFVIIGIGKVIEGIGESFSAPIGKPERVEEAKPSSTMVIVNGKLVKEESKEEKEQAEREARRLKVNRQVWEIEHMKWISKECKRYGLRG
jgi:hypothetical protein